MLSIERERHVEHVGHCFGRLIASPIGKEEKQVLGEAQISLWFHSGFPVREPMRSRDDERDLRQQSDRFTNICVVRPVGGIRIGHAQQRDAGPQNVHRTRSRRNHAKERFDRTRKDEVCGELRRKIL